MRVSAVVLALALCTSSGRRVRAGSEQLPSSPNRTQLQANSSFHAPKPEELATLLLALQNPVAGWQGVGHGQHLAMNKPRGNFAGSRAQVRLQAQEAAQRRFSYQPKPLRESGYDAGAGQRPRRTESRDFTTDGDASTGSSYRADTGHRPRRREGRDFNTGGYRPRPSDGGDFVPDNDDMDGDYQRTPSRSGYRADGGFRPPQRRDEDSFGGEYRKRAPREGTRRRETRSLSAGSRGARRGGDQDEQGDELPGGAERGGSRALGAMIGDDFHSDHDHDFQLSGDEYVYGVSPVLAALRAQQRDVRKLYMQNTFNFDKRKDMPAMREIVKVAEHLNVEIEEKDKGFLCRLVNNRPHQGLVLEAAPLERKPMQLLPTVKEGEAPVWLALDEVTDPMNFGSLLRTAFFLGVDGVFMSQKNCAPLTPVVSKTSAGAMEIMKVHEVKNLPKTLEAAKEAGWQVVGTALNHAVAPSELDHAAPTVLVLGNEGHGLRTNVKNACSKMVKIPGGLCGAGIGGKNSKNRHLVDSLNVGVAGGVLLHSILEARGKFQEA